MAKLRLHQTLKRSVCESEKTYHLIGLGMKTGNPLEVFKCLLRYQSLAMNFLRGSNRPIDCSHLCSVPALPIVAFWSDSNRDLSKLEGHIRLYGSLEIQPNRDHSLTIPKSRSELEDVSLDDLVCIRPSCRIVGIQECAMSGPIS